MTETTSGAPAVRLDGLTKRFGPVTAVDDLHLDIADGEFFAMLGPSGSGKTTVLRLVAGFESPTSGRVELGGQDVTHAPPFRRDVNTVFQDYALFPHMDVIGNVEYGLKVRKVAKDERRRRAEEALGTVQLGHLATRRPGQLSGGQRQRVALARALVNRPRVLLLDEPLGALDLKLRREMQIELKQIQREVGITFVFVTHDQEEALTMADRIAVFNDGRVEQVATPSDLYERPASPFVAGFVGTSNLLSGAAAERVVGQHGTFSIRPEKITLVPDGEPDQGAADASGASGTVREVVYLGSSHSFLVELDAGARLTVLRQSSGGSDAATQADRGERVRLTWSPVHVIDLGGEQPSPTSPTGPPAGHLEKETT